MSTQMSLKELVEATMAGNPEASLALREACRPRLVAIVTASVPGDLPEQWLLDLDAAQIAEAVVESLPGELKGYQWLDEESFTNWLVDVSKRHLLDLLAEQIEGDLKAWIESRLPARLQQLCEGSEIWNKTWEAARRTYPRFTWKGHEKFLAWWKTIAQNQINDRIGWEEAQIRGPGRVVQIGQFADDSGPMPGLEPADPHHGPSSEARRHERSEKLGEAMLVHLTPQEREAIEKWQELGGYREAAKALGVSHETIRRRCKQAMQKLRAVLGDSFLSSK